MEVSLNTSPVALPQQQQSNTPPTPAADAGAVPTLQGTPDNVVTAAVAPSETNVRDDDALRRQGGNSREGRVASLQDLELNGLRTRVGFDAESETVFLEILQPRTDQVIQRIPSEGLVQFLNEQFDQLITDAATDTTAVDTSA
ncbi:hypothetical protein [Hwanghaeella sp.]|uniref:hypothetical protein n=1 Tax=Hwanghaeella sp. TaxID=2605943 RepID=UPI003CCB9B53